MMAYSILYLYKRRRNTLVGCSVGYGHWSSLGNRMCDNSTLQQYFHCWRDKGSTINWNNQLDDRNSKTTCDCTQTVFNHNNSVIFFCWFSKRVGINLWSCDWYLCNLLPEQFWIRKKHIFQIYFACIPSS